MPYEPSVITAKPGPQSVESYSLEIVGSQLLSEKELESMPMELFG
jgi:hypothetical protein